MQAKTATGEVIDAAEIAYEMAQSLIDIIMKEEAEGQASLFAPVAALPVLLRELKQRSFHIVHVVPTSVDQF